MESSTPFSDVCVKAKNETALSSQHRHLKAPLANSSPWRYPASHSHSLSFTYIPIPISPSKQLILLTVKQHENKPPACPKTSSAPSFALRKRGKPYGVLGSPQFLQPIQGQEVRRVLVNELHRLLHPPLLAQRGGLPDLHFFPRRLRQNARIEHLAAGVQLPQSRSGRRCAACAL